RREAGFPAAVEGQIGFRGRALQRPGVERLRIDGEEAAGGRWLLIALRVDVLQLIFYFPRRGVGRVHAVRITHPDPAVEALERWARQLLLVAHVEELRRGEGLLHGRRVESLGTDLHVRDAEHPRVGWALGAQAVDLKIERRHLLADPQSPHRM